MGLDPEVDLVLDFLNTVDVEDGTDVLDDPTAWQSWLAGRQLPTGIAPEAARRVRDALRASVGDPDRLAQPVSVAARIELDGGPPVLAPTDGVSAVLIAAGRLAVLGEWPRMKICPADDCRWAFYDRSRNRSRTWCSMRVCGNREKARAWRARAREPGQVS